MFHVKHDLGHDPAVAASNGLEYAPAGAHDIRWARPEEHSEPGVDLATGRPVLATAGARRARGAVRAARHLATVQTMPAAVQLYPKAWARRSPTTPRRVLATSGPNEGVWGRFRAGCCGARRRPGMNVTPSGLGRGNIDCGVSRGRICRRCPTRASCPVSRKRRGGAPDSTDTAIRVTTRLDEVVAQTLGGMDGCTSVNAVLNAVLGVASSDRRILLDP